ncbi:E3 ubiquitin-protein ligase TRIM45-like isoform X2 [Littorina saxatilis]|uniref:Uncharacterized protein n=1 Tax=Littorina saxatilis TaxID=31220 RepID=A0AAN9B2F6_9CAEN
MKTKSVRVATTGMTTLNPIDNDATTDTTCSICQMAFQVPKILPCSHTFCQACLIDGLNVLGTPQCPTCSCNIADPKLWADRDAEGWKKAVVALPTDLVTEAVAQSARELSKGLSCAGCRDSAAVSICTTCGDKFCRFCAGVHRNTSMSRHHKVENLSSMTPETFAEIRPAVCSSHSNVPAEFFCSAHEAAICQRCAATQHRACPEVKSYHEEKEKFREEIAAMSSNLKATAKKIEQAISDLDQRSVDMRNKHQKALDEIDRDYHQLKKAVKTCQRRLKRQAEDDLAKAKDRVRKVKGTLHRRKEGLQAHRVSLQRLKRSMPSTVVTDHKARFALKSQISDLDTIVTLPAEVKSESKAPPRIYKEWLKVVEKEMKGVDPAPMALGFATRTSFTQLGDSWRCSPVCGSNVVLSNSRRTARTSA